MDEKEISKFIFEMGHLKRIKHEGWRLVGIDSPESIAGHSLRAAQIGYILADMEKLPNPEKVCTMLVFHDIGEARIGDVHKVGNRYIEADEKRAVSEQLDRLGSIKGSIFPLWNEMEEKETREGIVAKDADLLDMAFQAKEYIEQGHANAQNWIDNVGKKLMTDSAKSLWKQLQEMDCTSWWHGLKKID
jgi:putative hydrolase of HD superfamily